MEPIDCGPAGRVPAEAGAPSRSALVLRRGVRGRDAAALSKQLASGRHSGPEARGRRVAKRRLCYPPGASARLTASGSFSMTRRRFATGPLMPRVPCSHFR